MPVYYIYLTVGSKVIHEVDEDYVRFASTPEDSNISYCMEPHDSKEVIGININCILDTQNLLLREFGISSFIKVDRMSPQTVPISSQELQKIEDFEDIEATFLNNSK